MSKTIYVNYLSEQPNSNSHYLNRLIKLLNHFILIEPEDKLIAYHQHHIVPKSKSWKPEWKKVKDNLLKVPAKAHYVIHHLMWKAFPKDYSMMHAFERMVNSKRYDYKILAKTYSNLIKSFAEQSKNYMLLFHQINPNFVKRGK